MLPLTILYALKLIDQLQVPTLILNGMSQLINGSLQITVVQNSYYQQAPQI